MGFGALNWYANAAGETGALHNNWPADCNIQPAAEGHTLLMFLHPQCPCSRASVSELARLMANVGGQVDARVYFFQPSGKDAAWTQTDLWNSAAAIPGVQVQADADARLARQFGAAVSGHAVLYDAAGQLLFSGGITASRGHEGDNAGRSAIVDLVRGLSVPGPHTQRTEPRPQSTPVFGCPIVTDH